MGALALKSRALLPNPNPRGKIHVHPHKSQAGVEQAVRQAAFELSTYLGKATVSEVWRALVTRKGRDHYDGDVNMPAFLTAKNLKPYVPSDLAVTSSQVEFLTLGGMRAFGYSADLLPKVCYVGYWGACLVDAHQPPPQARANRAGLPETRPLVSVPSARFPCVGGRVDCTLNPWRQIDEFIGMACRASKDASKGNRLPTGSCDLGRLRPLRPATCP